MFFAGCCAGEVAGAPPADPVLVGADDRHCHVYVTNERSGDVSIIDSKTREVVRTIIVGKRPRGVHVSSDGKLLYVATSGTPSTEAAGAGRVVKTPADPTADGIAIIDLVTGKRVRQLQVGASPADFAVSHDERHVIVANEDVEEASIWETKSGRLVAKTPVSPGPVGVVLHPSRDAVYVICEDAGEIVVLDTLQARVLTKIKTGGRPRTVVFSADGTRAYVPLVTKNEVAVVNAEAHTWIETVAMPTGWTPTAATISADGNEVYVTAGRGGDGVAVLDAKARKVVATTPVGEDSRGVEVSPDGAYVWAANGGSNDVTLIDAKGRREVTTVAVGEGPWGVAIGPVIVP